MHNYHLPFDEIEDEIWKPVIFLEGYEASSFGRIRVGFEVHKKIVLLKDVKYGVPVDGWLIVKETTREGNGVSYVKVWQTKKYKTKKGMIKNRFIFKMMSVACLVADAFVGRRPYVLAIHLDGNQLNNRPENLKWGFMAESVALAYKRGTRKKKFTDDQAKEIRTRLLSGEKAKDLAKEFGCSCGMISHIKSGKCYKRNGEEIEEEFKIE